MNLLLVILTNINVLYYSLAKEFYDAKQYDSTIVYANRMQNNTQKYILLNNTYFYKKDTLNEMKCIQYLIDSTNEFNDSIITGLKYNLAELKYGIGLNCIDDLDKIKYTKYVAIRLNVYQMYINIFSDRNDIVNLKKWTNRYIDLNDSINEIKLIKLEQSNKLKEQQIKEKENTDLTKITGQRDSFLNIIIILCVLYVISVSYLIHKNSKNGTNKREK